MSEAIFRGYDIRGRTGVELTEAIVAGLAAEFARIATNMAGRRPVVFVGYDGRPSGAAFVRAAMAGIRAAGGTVKELGVVPTPLVYFASSREPGSFGLAVTASHLAQDWNGLKFCRGSEPIHTDVLRGYMPLEPSGTDSTLDVEDARTAVLDAYRTTLADAAADCSGMSVVVDCQNGAASVVAPLLLSALGLGVTAIHTAVGSPYPFGTPDPAVRSNLVDLQAAVVAQQADMGLAFDGDADRIGVVDSTGAIVSADELLALFAADVVGRMGPQRVVYDVLTSPVVSAVVQNAGGTPIEAPSGHAHVQEAVRDHGAVLGGESSGHIFFADSYRGATAGYDDGLYAGARLVDLVSRRGRLDKLRSDLPPVVATDEWRPFCPDDVKRDIVAAVADLARQRGETVSALDGVKIHRGPLAWGLVRAANTEPALSIRAVGPDDSAAQALLAEISSATREVATARGISL